MLRTCKSARMPFFRQYKTGLRCSVSSSIQLAWNIFGPWLFLTICNGLHYYDMHINLFVVLHVFPFFCKASVYYINRGNFFLMSRKFLFAFAFMLTQLRFTCAFLLQSTTYSERPFFAYMPLLRAFSSMSNFWS